MLTSREVRLVRRPSGLPVDEDFEIAEVEVLEAERGQVTVRNRLMSVDPYMRGRMNDVESYSEPFALGVAMNGGSIGEVVASEHDGFAVGDLVSGSLGWREAYTADGALLTKLPETDEPSYYLGALGGTGLTAYVGMLDIAEVKAGETVFISGAAGAVGSVAGQIGKELGCRVIGSAGSDEKVRWLTEDLGFDAAFNYHEVDLEQALAEAAPDGIDAYFDNVGYEHLQAAINHLNDFGRVALCGSIAGYNAAEPLPGPNNLASIVRKRLTLQGFIISDHAERRPEFLREMQGWIAEGQLRPRETVVEGLDHAVDAFRSLFDGGNTGKMIVAL
jgi:NADPH-dependent curcumin reductase CurA